MDRLMALNYRLHWLGKRGVEHERYFEKYQTRSGIIEVVRQWLVANPRSEIRVLEFGCSGGNNLRLMREMLPVPVSFVGFDIQAHAISFAQRMFPDDQFIVGDDHKLLAMEKELGTFDLFIASGVFSYIPENRCQAVLACSARLADYLLVCDILCRLREASGIKGAFHHPYLRLCESAGLELYGDIIGSTTGHEYNTFMARSKMRS